MTLVSCQQKVAVHTTFLSTSFSKAGLQALQVKISRLSDLSRQIATKIYRQWWQATMEARTPTEKSCNFRTSKPTLQSAHPARTPTLMCSVPLPLQWIQRVWISSVTRRQVKFKSKTRQVARTRAQSPCTLPIRKLYPVQRTPWITRAFQRVVCTTIGLPLANQIIRRMQTEALRGNSQTPSRWRECAKASWIWQSRNATSALTILSPKWTRLKHPLPNQTRIKPITYKIKINLLFNLVSNRSQILLQPTSRAVLCKCRACWTSLSSTRLCTVTTWRICSIMGRYKSKLWAKVGRMRVLRLIQSNCKWSRLLQNSTHSKTSSLQRPCSHLSNAH